jgi:multidrug efflux pump subunit AcrB
LLPGIVGKFMRIIPITVSLALAASMVEAFLILPSHFADWPGRRLVQRTERPWLRNLQNSYERLLRLVVRRRYLFVGAMLLSVPVAGAMVPLVGVDMFAGEDINTFQVRVRMPTGTNLETTLATLRRFEEAALGLPREEVRAVHATAGLVMTDEEWVFRPDVGQVWLDLPLSYQRLRSADEVMDDVRRRIEAIPGPVHVELAKLNTGPPVGKPVEVKLKGKYLDELQDAAQHLQAFLTDIDGITEVGSDFRQGSKEVRVRVDPERAALAGLSVGQLGLGLRAAIDGVDAGRLYDGDEEIDIVVRIDKRRFSSAQDLLQLPVTLANGRAVSLAEVATLDVSPSYAEIRRYQNQRAITVFANVDKAVTDTVSVNGMIRDWYTENRSRMAGVNLDFGGEFQEFKDAFTSLAQLFLIGVLIIYLILGAQFRSYVQPIVILFTVPFAFTGAVLGLLVSGNPFSVATLFGMVALAGVAVNDAIVLISFVNEAKERGVPPEEAVVQAGRLRLRPVILTSVTTIGGLLPMAMGLGGMSLTWGPLANTIVWGLVVATALTLCFIPAVYLVLVHDARGLARRLLGLGSDGEEQTAGAVPLAKRDDDPPHSAIPR